MAEKDKGSPVLRLIPRALFLLACVAAVAYGLGRERYQVYSMSGQTSRTISGPEFTEVASFDGVMSVEGRLYDIYSIAGLSVSTNEKGELQTGVSSEGSKKPKDCAT